MNSTNMLNHFHSGFVFPVAKLTDEDLFSSVNLTLVLGKQLDLFELHVAVLALQRKVFVIQLM